MRFGLRVQTSHEIEVRRHIEGFVGERASCQMVPAGNGEAWLVVTPKGDFKDYMDASGELAGLRESLMELFSPLTEVYLSASTGVWREVAPHYAHEHHADELKVAVVDEGLMDIRV